MNQVRAKKMVFRVSDEKIWVFYSIHEKYLKEVEKNNSDLALTQFCLNYKVSSKALAMFLYRYRFKMESNPELYKKIREYWKEKQLSDKEWENWARDIHVKWKINMDKE